MIKRISAALIAALLLITLQLAAYAEAVVTKHKDEESEQFIWDELSIYSPSDAVTAGVMGYFWRESFMKSNAVAGWPTWDSWYGGDLSAEFTAEVDKGLSDGSSREYFIHEIMDVHGGYGLGQWYALSYLDHFYDFMREHGGSIGDASLQCQFMFESLQKNEKLWNLLIECDDPVQCGRYIGYLYDGTAMSETIAGFSGQYYEKYADMRG